ncbi:MAG TPA: PQQ-binding-like beta-propeller repeat protein [Pyrinomonadaceae bacterium]|nr:PQQ-binding-like beta-propeller repeat protein [Pyrinomonadaceae bacterium]
MKLIFFFLSILLFVGPTFAQSSDSQAWHTNDISEIKFNEDASKLISYSAGDGWLFLWDVQSGRLIWRNKTGFIQRGDEYYTLTSFAFSHDEKFIASGSGNGTVALWDAKTGHLIWRTDAHTSNVTIVEFSPDGNSIISAATPEDGGDEVKVITVENGEIIKKLEGKPCTVIAIAFTDDGKILRTGNLDGQVTEWELASGKSQRAEDGKGCRLHRTYEWETSFSGDLSLSAQRTGETEVTIFRNAKPMKVLEADGYRIYSRFSADGSKLVVSGYAGFTFYDLEKGTSRKIEEFSRTGSTIDLSSDGRWFAEGRSYGDAAIKVTDVSKGESRFIGKKSSKNIAPPLIPTALEERLLAERSVKQIEIDKANSARDQQAIVDIQKFKQQVFITFEHFGDMTDPGEKRMIESDEPKESKISKPAEYANAIWLRLYNDSPLPIAIPTQSMYLPRKNCFFELKSGRKVFGLCDKREISIWHGLEDKKGKQLPYGVDFGASSILLPKTSALFAIPRELLKGGKAIRFNFTFQNDTVENKVGDYGKPVTLRFGARDLPKNIMPKKM